jgi:hypothetical protein
MDGTDDKRDERAAGESVPRDGWRGLLDAFWYAVTGAGELIEALLEPLRHWRGAAR